jgi:hypothetical protein
LVLLGQPRQEIYEGVKFLAPCSRYLRGDSLTFPGNTVWGGLRAHTCAGHYSLWNTFDIIFAILEDITVFADNK